MRPQQWPTSARLGTLIGNQSSKRNLLSLLLLLLALDLALVPADQLGLSLVRLQARN